MMYNYYHQYLPEGMTNISPEGLKTLTETLETTYSDDVPHPITLTRIQQVQPVYQPTYQPRDQPTYQPI